MAKILNWVKVEKILSEKGLMIFTLYDLMRIFNVSASAVTFFVHRNTKKGLLIRLKKSQKGSLYAFADKLPSQYLIANRVYEPSYISFDTALSFHKIIPETIYGITSSTTKATREFRVANIQYKYFKIKKEIYLGYKPIKYLNNTILIAEPEKALADYVYFIDLNKRSLNYERINLRDINRTKLMQYIKLYKRPKMYQIIEKIYANFRKYSRTY